jgi:hypothetical protein
VTNEAIAQAEARSQNREKIEAVYDHRNTLYLTALYYGRQLRKYQRINHVFDFVVTVGTSSALGGLKLWSATAVWENAWQIVLAISAVAAILRATLHLGGARERYAKLHALSWQLFYDNKELAEEIAAQARFTDEMRKIYLSILERARGITKDDDPYPSKRARLKLQKEVKRRFPPEDDWVPA